MGDFNFGDGQQPETSALHEYYEDYGNYIDAWLALSPDNPGTTYHGYPNRRLDRILVRSQDWEPLNIRLFGNEQVIIGGENYYASDHYGVVATLRRKDRGTDVLLK
jgi:endonuclease/exonuclease/phosphatase family metal-dependent hydrolase